MNAKLLAELKETRVPIVLTLITLLGIVLGLVGANTPLGSVGYLIAFLAGGIPAGIEAIKSLLQEKKLDVDLLMVLAALGAASIGQALDGAVLLLLFSVSNTLQDIAMGRTKSAINALMEISPAGANVRVGEVETWLTLDKIKIGDTLIIKPGERIAADAKVIAGESSADESAIAGESLPVDKQLGSELYSGTINLNGSLEAQVLKPAGESTLAQLIVLMEEAQTQKSKAEHITEKYESPYATLVLVLVPVVYLVLHYFIKLESAAAWYRAMTFMVTASPCAVVISTPAVMLSAMAASARAGVLFKSSSALAALADVKTIAFDKTGTLTQAKMSVQAIHSDNEQLALEIAAALESHSEHPIAKALIAEAADRGITAPKVELAQAISGHGIEAKLGTQNIWAGNERLAAQKGAALGQAQKQLLSTSSTVVIVGIEQQVVGIFYVADTIRPNAKAALASLDSLGVATAMLTGDNEAVAAAVAAELRLSEYHANLLPEDKLRLIAQLSAPVAMVGDGVNDAPALARADLGIAVASGSGVAIESADIVLMQNDLSKIVGAIALAKSSQKTVVFNLSFAFLIILIAAPLAILGIMPLPLGVLAHEGGTVFVVFMGLRLLAYKF